MPIIAPFHGLRYNLKKVGSLAKVVTPPYDIISPAEQEAFYKLHPNNFIRVVYGKELPKDDEKENRYSRAKKALDAWLKQGILKEDEQLSVYPHLEEYKLGAKTYKRWGVIALVRLDSPIFHHEHTRPRPITDRLKLLETLESPLSPIFGLIPDTDTVYRKFVTAACKSKPAASVTVKGVKHALWKVSDPAWIKKLSEMLRSKELVIADGHHRLTAALRHRDDRRTNDRSFTENAPYNYAMFYLASAADEEPGLLPTHRVLTDVPAPQIQEFLHSEELNVEKFPAVEKVEARLQALRSQHALGVGLYTGNGGWYLLTPKERAPYELDVEWLHQELLPNWVGNDPEISYTQDVQEGIKQLKSKKGQALFVMQHPRLSDVMGRARTAVRMPGKTTYFYPKPLAGLVEYKFGR